MEINGKKISTPTGSKAAKCDICGKVFYYTPVSFNGQEYGRPRLCPEHQRQFEAEEEKKRLIKQEKERQARAIRSWENICPPLYRSTDPSRLPQVPFKKVMSWHYGPRGLVLYGPTGTGKTRCAYLLIREIMRTRVLEEKFPNRPVDKEKLLAYDSTDFANECSDAFYNGRGSTWCRKMINVPLLLIDDLGNEPSGERGSGELFHIIKRRSEELLPVIITTNAVGDEMSKKVRGPLDRGLALVRRVREFCEPIPFGIPPKKGGRDEQ
jgi:DNA replication protein DnaC